MKELAVLLCEADVIEKLEAQVKEKEVELSRFGKSVNLFWNNYEQLLKDNEVLTRDIRQNTTGSKELQEVKQVTRANERAIQCFYAILQSFAETNFERLAAADCYTFLGVPETATPKEIGKL